MRPPDRPFPTWGRRMDASMDTRHSAAAVGEPRVVVSRTALLHNAAVVRRQLPAGTRLCAIIKANAYGHGADAVADTLCNYSPDGSDTPAADALAVASLDEAAALPAAATASVPILVFRPLENALIGGRRDKIEEAIRFGWVLTVCTPAAAEDVARVALAMGRRAAVQIMVDTGMTRSGVAPDRLPALLHKVDGRPSLRLAGLCTHFANSEDPADGFTDEQLDQFDAATAGYAAFARGRVLRHAANSGAVFFHPASYFDMVRPGLALYGIDPTGKPSLDRNLRPALRWTAPLVGLHDVPAGTTVGYGRTWTAGRPSRIGLVPVGYADGYARCFSNRAVVMVHGRPAPVVGRVSMDLTTVDLTDVPQARTGDEVTLLDSDPLSPASVYRLAEWGGTVPYEIFCGIGPRVHRVVADAAAAGGELPAARDAASAA